VYVDCSVLSRRRVDRRYMCHETLCAYVCTSLPTYVEVCVRFSSFLCLHDVKLAYVYNQNMHVAVFYMRVAH
jgi:hypothetical protein